MQKKFKNDTNEVEDFENPASSGRKLIENEKITVIDESSTPKTGSSDNDLIRKKKYKKNKSWFEN